MNKDSRVLESGTNAQFRYNHVLVQVKRIDPVILRVHIAVIIWLAFHQIHWKNKWDIQLSIGTIEGSLDVTPDPDWWLVVEQ